MTEENTTYRQKPPMRSTTEKLQRSMGVLLWAAGGTMMTAVGSIQGLAGSWVCGFALYGIMSREWDENPAERRYLIEEHLLWTAALTVIAGVVDAWLWQSGAGWRIHWNLLPVATISMGAAHNWRWAPRIDQQRYRATRSTS